MTKFVVLCFQKGDNMQNVVEIISNELIYCLEELGVDGRINVEYMPMDNSLTIKNSSYR